MICMLTHAQALSIVWACTHPCNWWPVGFTCQKHDILTQVGIGALNGPRIEHQTFIALRHIIHPLLYFWAQLILTVPAFPAHLTLLTFTSTPALA